MATIEIAVYGEGLEAQVIGELIKSRLGGDLQFKNVELVHDDIVDVSNLTLARAFEIADTVRDFTKIRVTTHRTTNIYAVDPALADRQRADLR